MQPKTLKRTRFSTGTSSRRTFWLRSVLKCRRFDWLTLVWAVSLPKDPHTTSSLVNKPVSILSSDLVSWNSSDKLSVSFSCLAGTIDHIPPEYVHGSYKPGPSTVWQIGVVLYETLHGGERFETTRFLLNELQIQKGLTGGKNLQPPEHLPKFFGADTHSWSSSSIDCQEFLSNCLAREPEDRPTLTQLQRHCWLRWLSTFLWILVFLVLFI